MADTKVSALTAAVTVGAGDILPLIQTGTSKSVTASVLRSTFIGAGLSNASQATVSAGYAADTYLAGSAITIPVAGGWAVGSIVKWSFDMAKTAAGVATPIITVRMGTTGTTGDAGVLTITRSAGTAAADTGLFQLFVTFRSVGSGTAAVIQCVFMLSHTGNGAGLDLSTFIDVAPFTSAGFNSTTQTVIGLSFNGGASFSGTNTFVIAEADKL